jgi:HSP20 family molecular chaperone IbpA
MSFDDIFKEMRDFQKKLSKDMFKGFGSFGDLESFGDIEKLEKKIKEGTMKGNWQFEPIEKPGMKGFIIRGYIGTPQLGDKPDEILPPLKPKLKDPREPLYDISVGTKTLTTYIELPGIKEDEIKLGFEDRKLSLEAGNFKTKIDLSGWIINPEKKKTEYRNGILQITFPKTDLKSEMV